MKLMSKDDFNNCLSNVMFRRYILVRISENPDYSYQSKLDNRDFRINLRAYLWKMRELAHCCMSEKSARSVPIIERIVDLFQKL